MKAIQFYVSMMLILMVSSFALNGQNGWNNGIKGKGEIISKEFDLDKFSSIGLGFSGDLILTQGDNQSVRIEAQANIMDVISTKVKGGDWNIKFTKRVSKHDGVKIYVTMKTLKDLSLGGSGNITATNKFKNLNDVDISLGGSGNITIDLVVKDLEVALGGSGNIKLGGSCNNLEIGLAGSGNIDAFELNSKTCEVSTTGSGNIDVAVKNSLEVSLVGSGNVRYRGNPEVDTTIMGSGSVSKKRGM